MSRSRIDLNEQIDTVWKTLTLLAPIRHPTAPQELPDRVLQRRADRAARPSRPTRASAPAAFLTTLISPVDGC